MPLFSSLFKSFICPIWSISFVECLSRVFWCYDLVTNFEFRFCWCFYINKRVEQFLYSSFCLLLSVSFLSLNVLFYCIFSIYVAEYQNRLCCRELWTVSTFSVALIYSIFQQHWIFLHFLLSIFYAVFV